MDKQDFQEQDFMEILMRLPCRIKRKYLLSAETISFLRVEEKYWIKRYLLLWKTHRPQRTY